MQGSGDSACVRSRRYPRHYTCLFAFLIVPGLAGCAPLWRTPTAAPPLAKRTAPSYDGAGCVDGPGRQIVIAQCTGCHSGRLVQQNRATRDGWESLIRWMQKEHGLWNLTPDVEAQVLDYLATYYGRAGEGSGRRLPLAAHLLPPERPARRTHEMHGEER